MKELLKNIGSAICFPVLLLLIPFMALVNAIKKGDGDDIRSAIEMVGCAAVGMGIALLISLVLV